MPDEDLDYYTALPVFLARLRKLPEAGEPETPVIALQVPAE
jgi:hypothetical protein